MIILSPLHVSFLVHWKFQASDLVTWPTFSEMPLLHTIIIVLMQRIYPGAYISPFLGCILYSLTQKLSSKALNFMCFLSSWSIFNLPTATLPTKYVRGREEFYLSLKPKKNIFYLVVYDMKTTGLSRVWIIWIMSHFFPPLKSTPLCKLMSANTLPLLPK